MSTQAPAAVSGIDAMIAGLFPMDADGGTDSEEVRVGIDLVTVAEVAESVASFGDRYLRRVFTPRELSWCRSQVTDPAVPYSIESLAARFAAKEAIVKILRPEGPRPEWADIEVVRHPSGWCGVHLTGGAASLADAAGIDRWAVSLTHHAGLAAAVVVGTPASSRCRKSGPDRQPGLSEERDR
jgi:holo-[acyl-carrier protein] synthase